jgi:serine protease Do
MKTTALSLRPVRLASTLVLCLAGLAPPALAQDAGTRIATPDVSAEDVGFAKRLSRVFREVAESAEPAVVHITRLSERVVRRSFWDAGERRVVPDGVGSGVIVDARAGIVVTNNHVIANASQLVVKLADGREVPAVVRGRDAATDLAVLELRPEGGVTLSELGLREVAFADSEELEVGEWVVAIGSPFGLDSSVTQGIISAKGRTVAPRETGIAYSDYIQTDAAINPGNSGGPLLNLEARLVGINTAIASRTGGYDGIGFAIPSNTVRAVVDNLLRNGRVVRGYLGVDLRDAEGGVLVATVNEGSPASEAGLREGDVITRFNGGPVNEARLRTNLAITNPGTMVKLEVLREGKPITLSATLADREQVVAALYERQGQTYIRALGLGVRDVSRERARAAGLRDGQGVEVVTIEPGSVSASKLEPGDIIVAVDRQRVEDAAGMRELLANRNEDESFRVDVVRVSANGFVDSGFLMLQPGR